MAVGKIDLFGIPIDTPGKKYLLILALVTVLALGAKNLVRGRIGRMWMAMRDMDIAAEIIGIRPLHAKLSAFAVSSFYIGVAGALWGFLRLGSWEPLAFDIGRSFQVLFMVIIGGLGSILGSFLGAAFIVMVPIVLNQLPALAWNSAVHRDGVAHRVHGVRRHDRRFPDRRTARPRAVVGGGQGKAQAMAVPVLRCGRFGGTIVPNTACAPRMSAKTKGGS